MWIRLQTELIVGVALLCPAAVSAEQDAPALEAYVEGELGAELHDVAECDLLFGDEESWTEHRAARERELLSVRHSEGLIEMSFNNAWSEPTPIEYAELELVEILPTEQGPAAALVFVDDTFAGYNCPTGYYLLRRDHAIGESARVLAVLDAVVLLEYQGELRYLLEHESTRPEWRMIWQSSWSIVLPANHSKSYSSSRARKTARHKRRSKRRR